MSTKPLANANLEHSTPTVAHCPDASANLDTGQSAQPALQQRFYLRDGAWYVKHGDQSSAGPFADKADAQMAMLYFSARAFWPSEKQLREFARSGK